jgi:hypothetical protein
MNDDRQFLLATFSPSKKGSRCALVVETVMAAALKQNPQAVAETLMVAIHQQTEHYR